MILTGVHFPYCPYTMQNNLSRLNNPTSSQVREKITAFYLCGIITHYTYKL